MAAILYLEDDALVAASVQRLIKRIAHDVHVIHVLSVDAAITALGICQVQLVLSDYNVFGARTGADLLAFTRAMKQPPPFVFLSSDERCADHGVPWIQKPAAPSVIRDVVMLHVDPPKVVMEVAHV